MEREALRREFEGHVSGHGFELVDLETAGTKATPILRLRIERPGADPTQPGQGVTVDECAQVSRAIEQTLDEQEGLAERYVLEVSSAGVERPLVKAADYDRFQGKEIAVKVRNAVGDHGKRLEGILQGLEGDQVVLELAGQHTVRFPLGDVMKAHLVFRWKEKDRKKL